MEKISLSVKKMKKIIILLTMLFILCSFATAVDLTVGNIVYYKHDIATTVGVTSIDSVGLTNGTLVNGVTSGVAGKINEAYNFVNGDSEYISIADNVAFDSNSKTVNCWVKADQDVDALQIYRETGFSFGAVGGGGMRCQASDGAFSDAIDLTIDLTTGWNMVTCIYEQGTGTSIYLNGNLRNFDGTRTGNLIPNVANPTIGSTQTPNNYWDGEMDECGVWNRALNVTEIGALNNSGSGLSYPYGSSSSSSNFNLLYPINETHYSDFNGSIIINTSVLSNCYLNDTDFILQSTLPGNIDNFFNWYNNIPIEKNYSIQYSCTQFDNDFIPTTLVDISQDNDGTFTNYDLNHGEINGATFESSCMYDGCYSFDGVNDYIGDGSPTLTTEFSLG